MVPKRVHPFSSKELLEEIPTCLNWRAQRINKNVHFC
jgi:hypothetical protein